MVNQVVLEYLRVNKGNYNLNDLKKKILASGYSQKDIDEAMTHLNKKGKSAPSVSATINKINKTNIDMNANKPVVQNPVQTQNVNQPKKKKKWVKWLIISVIIFLILGLIGFGILSWISFF